MENKIEKLQTSRAKKIDFSDQISTENPKYAQIEQKCEHEFCQLISNFTPLDDQVKIEKVDQLTSCIYRSPIYGDSDNCNFIQKINKFENLERCFKCDDPKCPYNEWSLYGPD